MMICRNIWNRKAIASHSFVLSRLLSSTFTILHFSPLFHYYKGRDAPVLASEDHKSVCSWYEKAITVTAEEGVSLSKYCNSFPNTSFFEFIIKHNIMSPINRYTYFSISKRLININTSYVKHFILLLLISFHHIHHLIYLDLSLLFLLFSCSSLC